MTRSCSDRSVVEYRKPVLAMPFVSSRTRRIDGHSALGGRCGVSWREMNGPNASAAISSARATRSRLLTVTTNRLPSVAELVKNKHCLFCPVRRSIRLRLCRGRHLGPRRDQRIEHASDLNHRALLRNREDEIGQLLDSLWVHSIRST